MDATLLKHHRFQFINFCHVCHALRRKGNVNVNNDTHIMHVTKGNGTVEVDKHTYTISRGSVIAIPPFVKFVFDIKPHFEMRNIHFRL